MCQVNRTYGSAGRVTIDYETVDGVAVAGRDYVTTKGTLVFEDGETAKDRAQQMPTALRPTVSAASNAAATALAAADIAASAASARKIAAEDMHSLD